MVIFEPKTGVLWVRVYTHPDLSNRQHEHRTYCLYSTGKGIQISSSPLGTFYNISCGTTMFCRYWFRTTVLSVAINSFSSSHHQRAGAQHGDSYHTWGTHQAHTTCTGCKVAELPMAWLDKDEDSSPATTTDSRAGHQNGLAKYSARGGLCF